MALAPANITVKLKQIFFSSAQISFPQVIFAWVLFCCISISAVAFDFVGPWDMDHDGKIDMSDVQVSDPAGSPITGFTVQGTKLTFASALPIGSTSVKYYCAQ